MVIFNSYVKLPEGMVKYGWNCVCFSFVEGEQKPENRTILGVRTMVSSGGVWETNPLVKLVKFKGQWTFGKFEWTTVWWFGTWILYNFMIFHTLGIVTPTDEAMFFRGVGIPPTRQSLVGLSHMENLAKVQEICSDEDFSRWGIPSRHRVFQYESSWSNNI